MDGSGFARMGDAVLRLIVVLLIVVAISLPLAIWKAGELVVWLCSHIRWES
jgi:hypothetical protein